MVEDQPLMVHNFNSIKRMFCDTCGESNHNKEQIDLRLNIVYESNSDRFSFPLNSLSLSFFLICVRINPFGHYFTKHRSAT